MSAQWQCMFCQKPVAEQWSACCGEVAHTVQVEPCSLCDGSGQMPNNNPTYPSATYDCQRCDGTGVLEVCS